MILQLAFVLTAIIIGARLGGIGLGVMGGVGLGPQDKVLTERVAQAAALFDIRLLDHIIIAREGDFSFLRAGLV